MAEERGGGGGLRGEKDSVDVSVRIFYFAVGGVKQWRTRTSSTLN